MNKVLEELLAEAAKKKNITQEVTIGISDDEMIVLTKKADLAGVEVGEILRSYLSKTTAFSNSYFEEKKAKKTVKKGGE